LPSPQAGEGEGEGACSQFFHTFPLKRERIKRKKPGFFLDLYVIFWYAEEKEKK